MGKKKYYPRRELDDHLCFIEISASELGKFQQSSQKACSFSLISFVPCSMNVEGWIFMIPFGLIAAIRLANLYSPKKKSQTHEEISTINGNFF